MINYRLSSFRPSGSEISSEGKYKSSLQSLSLSFSELHSRLIPVQGYNTILCITYPFFTLLFFFVVFSRLGLHRVYWYRFLQLPSMIICRFFSATHPLEDFTFAFQTSGHLSYRLFDVAWPWIVGFLWCCCRGLSLKGCFRAQRPGMSGWVRSLLRGGWIEFEQSGKRVPIMCDVVSGPLDRPVKPGKQSRGSLNSGSPICSARENWRFPLHGRWEIEGDCVWMTRMFCNMARHVNWKFNAFLFPSFFFPRRNGKQENRKNKKTGKLVFHQGWL